MASALTDKFRKGAPFFQTTLSGSISDSDTSLTLASATGLPTDTAIDFVIDRIDQNGELLDPSLREVITGTVSGTTVTTDATRRGLDNTTAQAHTAGAVVEVNFTSDTWNDHIDGILTGHNQDGTHKAFTESDLVDTDQIVDDAVTTDKIPDENVTSAKLVQNFFKGRYQSDVSDSPANSDQSGLTVQFGWTQINGNGTNAISQAVTFPTQFSTILFVMPALMGGSAGAATGLTSFATNLVGGSGYTAGAADITTSGFTLDIVRNTGTFSAGTYFGASWIAIGII